jgi:hypothetical protein
MQIVMFYHSLLSDWNHGNAHFLRGVVSELQSRGHSIDVYESQDAWTWHEAADTRIFHPIDDCGMGATNEKSESSQPNKHPNNPKSRALLKVGATSQPNLTVPLG